MKTAFLTKAYQRPTLKEAQDFVGGYVEVHKSLNGKMQILCNEDGLSLFLDINEEASAICGLPVVGDVMILTDSALWEGE